MSHRYLSAFLLSSAVVAGLLLVSCGDDRSCEIAADCFSGEACTGGTCQLVSAENGSPNGTPNATPNASPNGTPNATPNNVVANNVAPNGAAGYRFIDLAAGQHYTCALDSEGALWCWGRNSDARLSVDSNENTVDRPSLVEGIDDVVDIAGGRNHRCARRGDGTVWCWGANFGIVTGASSMIVWDPTEMPLSDIVQLEMGGNSACALESDLRTLSCWGDTLALPVPALDEDVVDFAVGQDHSCLVTAGGAVRCWGSNYFEAVGSGDPVQGIAGATAISASERHTCAVANGDVYCWGWNEEGQGGRLPLEFQEKIETPEKVAGVSNAIDVFAGSTYTCALHDGDRFTCWGGLLGYEATVYTDLLISEPTQLFGIGKDVTLATAGWIHGCAVKTDEIWCWGDNSDRQLGEGGEDFRYEQPVRVLFP